LASASSLMTVRPCAAAIVVCRGGKFTVERAGAARLQYETVPDKQKADVIRKAKRGFEDVRIGLTNLPLRSALVRLVA